MSDFTAISGGGCEGDGVLGEQGNEKGGGPACAEDEEIDFFHIDDAFACRRGIKGECFCSWLSEMSVHTVHSQTTGTKLWYAPGFASMPASSFMHDLPVPPRPLL